MMPTMTGRGRAALLVTVLALASLVSGCDEARRVAEQRFVPRTPGVLTVATTLPAPGFWETGPSGPGDLTGGFEFEIATALAARFGLELDVVAIPFDRIVEGDLGGADMAIAQISITGVRDEPLDFSVPYYRSGAGVMARDGEAIDDLKTAREQHWGVVAGTTEADFVADVIRPGSDTAVVGDDLACARAVAAGTVDACLVDLTSALRLEQLVDGVTTVARFTTDEPWGIALPDGSSNIEAVDAAVRRLQADGSLDRFAGDWLQPALGRDPDRIHAIEART